MKAAIDWLTGIGCYPVPVRMRVYPRGEYLSKFDGTVKESTMIHSTIDYTALEGATRGSRLRYDDSP